MKKNVVDLLPLCQGGVGKVVGGGGIFLQEVVSQRWNLLSICQNYQTKFLGFIEPHYFGHMKQRQ